MNRQAFGQALKRHDWAYEYSECHHTRRAGRAGLKAIKEALVALEPPFTLRQLQAWAEEAVVDLFDPPPGEAGPDGRWRRKGASPVAVGRYRSQLLTADKFDEIKRWFDETQQ